MAATKTHYREFINQRPMCSFCGERPSVAFWRAMAGEIHCCSKCAFEILPAMMADAAVMDEKHSRTLGNVNDARFRIDAAFWRAAFLSALRADESD